jgi:hypothetical protein
MQGGGLGGGGED